jgi:hypothetical protein
MIAEDVSIGFMAVCYFWITPQLSKPMMSNKTTALIAYPNVSAIDTAALLDLVDQAA